MNERGPGGCTPLAWMVVVALVVAGIIYVTKSLFPAIFAGLIVGTLFS